MLSAGGRSDEGMRPARDMGRRSGLRLPLEFVGGSRECVYGLLHILGGVRH